MGCSPMTKRHMVKVIAAPTFSYLKDGGKVEEKRRGVKKNKGREEMRREEKRSEVK